MLIGYGQRKGVVLVCPGIRDPALARGITGGTARLLRTPDFDPGALCPPPSPTPHLPDPNLHLSPGVRRTLCGILAEIHGTPDAPAGEPLDWYRKLYVPPGPGL